MRIIKGTKKRNTESGFNLIEVMVALGILAFGILAIATMQERSLLGTSLAYSITDGTSKAMEKMEHLMALPFDDSELDAGHYSQPASGRFTTTYDVTDVNAMQKLLSVTVSWTDAGFGSRSSGISCYKVDVF